MEMPWDRDDGYTRPSDDDESDDRDIVIDNPTEDIPEDIILNPMQPQYTYRQWENYECVSKPSGPSILRESGIIDFDGAIVTENKLDFRASQSSGYLTIAPYFEASRMSIDIRILAGNPINELDPLQWQESMSVTLETTDSLTLDIDKDFFQLSLIKNGTQFLDQDEMRIISDMYQDFTIVITFKNYSECSLIQNNEDDDDDGDDNNEELIENNPISIYMILGGLIAFIILSFVLNTTGDSNDG